jgi:hypothetical protein
MTDGTNMIMMGHNSFEGSYFHKHTNTQKSESTMIQKLSRMLGSPEDTVVYIGDWDQHGKYLIGMEPSIGWGLRKAGYEVYLVREAYTSCTCHNCFGKTEKFRKRISKNPKHEEKHVEVHGF